MADMVLTTQKTSEDVEGAGRRLQAKGTRYGDLFTADWLHHLVQQGRVYTAGGATVTATITGQTSFVNTTPTFLLSVPANITAMLLGVSLVQDGSVAGGAVNVMLGMGATDLYSSGGASVTPINRRTDATVSNACTFRTNPTASAITTGRLRSYVLGQDISPAEGAPNGVFYDPVAPIYLVGAACFYIFTYAGTTGPTWDYSITWAELPSTLITG